MRELFALSSYIWYYIATHGHHRGKSTVFFRQVLGRHGRTVWSKHFVCSTHSRCQCARTAGARASAKTRPRERKRESVPPLPKNSTRMNKRRNTLQKSLYSRHNCVSLVGKTLGPKLQQLVLRYPADPRALAPRQQGVLSAQQPRATPSPPSVLQALGVRLFCLSHLGIRHA